MSDKQDFDTAAKSTEAKRAEAWRQRYAAERNLDPRTLKPIAEIPRSDGHGSDP